MKCSSTAFVISLLLNASFLSGIKEIYDAFAISVDIPLVLKLT